MPKEAAHTGKVYSEPQLDSHGASPLVIGEILPWTADASDPEYGWRRPEFDPRLVNYTNMDGNQLMQMFVEADSMIGIYVMHGFDAIARLKRFVDERQTKLREKPRADGLNLNVIRNIGGEQVLDGSPHLEKVYDFYRRWLTFLHYRSIVKLRVKAGVPGDWDRSRLNEFYDNMSKAPAQMLDAELRDQIGSRGDPSVPKPEKGFEWLWALSDILPDALASVLAARRWAQIYHQDMNEAQWRAWCCVPTMARLILVLLAKEHSFEYSMTFGHVEDVAIDKRVTLVAPKDAVFSRQESFAIIDELGPPLRAALASMQMALRNVHDFRLLRDWGYGRPWKKLYLLLDAKSDKKWTDRLGHRSLSSCIEDLLIHLRSSRKAYNVFDIHPMDMKNYNKEDTCTICLNEFGDGDILMEIWCNHRFHPVCIMEYWDSENRFVYNCPNCRYSPPTLRERVAIDAEASDIDLSNRTSMTVRSAIDNEISMSRRNGSRWSQLPLEYRVRIMQRAFSKRNAARCAQEKKEGKGILP